VQALSQPEVYKGSHRVGHLMARPGSETSIGDAAKVSSRPLF